MIVHSAVCKPRPQPEKRPSTGPEIIDSRPPWRRPQPKQLSGPQPQPKQPSGPQQPDCPPPQRMLDEIGEFRGANLNPHDLLDPAWTADYFEYCWMDIDEFGKGGAVRRPQMLGSSLPMPPPPPQRWTPERPPQPVLPGTWTPTPPPPGVVRTHATGATAFMTSTSRATTLSAHQPGTTAAPSSSSSSKCQAASRAEQPDAAAPPLSDLRFIFALAHTRRLFLIYRLRRKLGGMKRWMVLHLHL